MFTQQFGRFPMLELLEATTGWKLSTKDLLKIGLRVQTLRLAFSLREGVNPYFISLPGRAWGEIPHNKGPHKDKIIDYRGMIRGFYEYMGWNIETGIPSKEKLDEVGLGSIYPDLLS